MFYLYRDIDCSEVTRWGREVKIKTVRLRCKIVGACGKDEVFIKLGKSKYFPITGGITIRVLKSLVIKG